MALYLIWIRYCARFFGVISLVNIALCIIYDNGTPVQGILSDSDSILVKWTILNIASNRYLLIGVFFYSMIVIPGLVFVFQFKYMTKYQYIQNKAKDSKKVGEPQNSQEKIRPTSTDPYDYAMRRYTDLEVAGHSIMLEGLPRNIPRLQLEKKLTEIFQQFVSGWKEDEDENAKPQLMNVSVISDYEKCRKMFEDFKLAAGRYKMTYEINKQNLTKREYQRLTLTQKKWCGRKKIVFDAEEYYRNEIDELMYKIKAEEEHQSSQNTGIAFITFRDTELVEKMKDKNWIFEQFKTKVKRSDTKSLGINTLIIAEAYTNSDIEWHNIQKSQLLAIVKRTILFLALVIFSFLILTPTYAIELLSPVQSAIEKKIHNETIKGYVTLYFAPIITLCVNFGIIPLIIDYSCEVEDFRRKSSRQVSIMNRIFFFMIINTLIIPVTQTSAILFFNYLQHSNITYWPALLSSNLMTQQYFYIKFIIQLTFISNGFWLVDFFHRTQTAVLKKLHQLKYSNSVVQIPFKDTYCFDLGYHQSYSLVVLLNCLLFSTMVPLISFFAFLFFYVKQYVDTYNLIFVYFKIYESGGKMRRTVTSYMVFDLWMYMVVTVSFFSLKFSNEYWFAGTVLIATWSVIYIYTRLQVINAFNMDSDLRLKNLQWNSICQKMALKSFKKKQKSAMIAFKKIASPDEIENAKETQAKELEEFKTNVEQLIEKNTMVLKESYKHPFQYVDRSIYDDTSQMMH